MATKTRAKPIEWVGGLASMPGFVTGEGKPYRPEVLLWIGADGAVLGHMAGAPGEVVSQAAEHLRRTIRQPMYGKPHAPTRVRVASRELADALQAAHPGLEIVCAPTPELEEVMAAMREHMAEDAALEQSYLSPGVSPEAVGAFFRAAAALFRARPWAIVPSDQSLISVTIEPFGVRDAAVSVIGQMGESLGLIMFSGLDDFEAYLEMAEAAARGGAPKAPPHFALNFERGADINAGLRREILQHGWEVAGTDAYPWLVAVDEDLVTRPATAEEISIAEALARALVELLAEPAPLLAAWQADQTVERTLRVATHAGAVDVVLRVPYAPQTQARLQAPLDLMAALREVDLDGDDLDGEARRDLDVELLRQFSRSPEAQSVADIGACHFLIDLAVDYFGVTVVSLTSSDLRELIFETFPRKVSVPASEAGAIIDELRAFYTFLHREFALAQAEACLRVLSGDAVRRLEAALSDSSKFGLAKSLVMGGHDAGFDMTTREGVEAWMRTMPSLPLSSGSPRPTSRPEKRVDVRAKKDQRKAARKARKKNR